MGNLKSHVPSFEYPCVGEDSERKRQALCEKTKSSWQLWESHETTKQRHSKGFYKRLNLGELSGRAIEVSLPVIVSKVVQLDVNT